VHQAKGAADERQVLRSFGVAIVKGEGLKGLLHERRVGPHLEGEIIDGDADGLALADPFDGELPAARPRGDRWERPASDPVSAVSVDHVDLVGENASGELRDRRGLREPG
jgi:hypothetical protein